MPRWLIPVAPLLALAGCAARAPAAAAPGSSSDGSEASPAAVSPYPPSPASSSGPSALPSAPAARSGACWRMAEAARSTAPSPARPSTECVAGSPEIERDVAARLAREARDGDAGLVARIDYPCVTPGDPMGTVRAVIVEGHAGHARVVGLRSTGKGQFRARVLRVATGGGPNQTPPGPVEFFRTDLSEAAVVGTFGRLRSALAARITLERPAAVKGNHIELGAVGTSSNNLSLELVLEDAQGAVATRSWQGYRATLDIEQRLPVEFAWRALSELDIEKIPLRAAEPDDRALLREAWLGAPASVERPWYVTRGLLLLAAQAGSAELVPPIVELLGSHDEEIQRLGVDALAAISGRDLRRDASGNARALGEVVADYRRDCGSP